MINNNENKIVEYSFGRDREARVDAVQVGLDPLTLFLTFPRDNREASWPCLKLTKYIQMGRDIFHG